MSGSPSMMDSPLDWIPICTSLIYILLTTCQLLTKPSHINTTIYNNSKNRTLPPRAHHHRHHYHKIFKTTLLPTLLLATTFALTTHLLLTPQQILQRGTPSFLILTDNSPEEEAPDAWKQKSFHFRWERGIRRLHRVEPRLFHFARIQRVIYFFSALCTLLALVDNCVIAYRLRT